MNAGEPGVQFENLRCYSHPDLQRESKAKRLDTSTGSCANPYLAFSALLWPVWMGAQQDRAGRTLDKNIYELPPEELKKVPNVLELGEARISWRRTTNSR